MKRRVLYVQFTNPAGYPPLEHSSRILANEGWQVLFLGTGAQGANALEFPPHPGIVVRRMKFCPAGWRQKLHYFRYALWAAFQVLQWRPDWIYASDPLSCPVALFLSYFPGARVVYHEHDSPDLTAGERAPAFARLTLWARKKLARRAAVCVLPNATRLAHFKEQTGATCPVECVWNCPRRDEALPEPPVDAPGFIIFYHGTIVPARLPLALIQALALLPEKVVLRVAGYETVGHRGYVAELRGEAGHLGVAERFEFLGAFSRRELLAHCRGAHVGLSFMPAQSADLNLTAMTGASNKPFDYLACGLALLVSDLPDWKKLYVEPGYGRACDPEDAADTAAALRWFLEHPDETRKMGRQGRERVLNEWNYEKQFEPVNSILTGKQNRE